MFKNRPSSFYWLKTWTLANVIQLATQDFCKKFLNRQNDPCGRQFDQMTQAARSGQANIAEGNTRHSTSRETEMRLTDVARASISELQTDYLNWLLAHGELPWSVKSAEYQSVRNLQIDSPNFADDVIHNSAKHILEQKSKFSKWLSSDNGITQANCLLILCVVLEYLLKLQIDKMVEEFRSEGGFTEALTAERLAARTEQATTGNAPTCPKCNKPMIKRMAKKGSNAGKSFWSCSDFPNCDGTRSS